MTVCSTCKHANYCEIVAGGYSSQVKSCRDYRKGEMTNEEWFNGLPTTEKSSFLAKMVTEAIKEHGKCGATRCESSIWWDEWLKQPHCEVVAK